VQLCILSCVWMHTVWCALPLGNFSFMYPTGFLFCLLCGAVSWRRMAWCRCRLSIDGVEAHTGWVVVLPSLPVCVLPVGVLPVCLPVGAGPGGYMLVMCLVFGLHFSCSVAEQWVSHVGFNSCCCCSGCCCCSVQGNQKCQELCL